VFIKKYAVEIHNVAGLLQKDGGKRIIVKYFKIEKIYR
jgi:hypothetical protein